MNILQMNQTLFYILEQQPDADAGVSTPGVAYLRQQTELFQQDLKTAVFYRVFTAIPRFVNKQVLTVPPDLAFSLERIRPGFTIQGWTRDRLARVWWLLQLPVDGQETYVKTISELFKAAEMNELVALYSALPVLAYPEAWRFQATEGVRNNIADVQSAIMLNNPYPADYLDEAAWNQLILKAFFTEKDVSQIIGLTERKNARLTQTLTDYVAERRAAGRSLPEGIELAM
ncbi:EboA domain-containing protein [Spirosoma montaniterrae]|uniref:EboA domain-containing protein n=1 Tax=Spirosoma montaniterrae TaxID=1178516 RepID=A0A1P9WR97_9BACT|nr:EboA domain-containing protein [Spirosoma montaniterrae]AQG77894.1 hypothetical protein AWR27_00105 [Spirosoma montaniterrae]